MDVKISNPDKLFFPERGLIEGDLIANCSDLAPQLLNHVRRSRCRCCATRTAWTIDFPVVNNARALTWIVNLGCIDLHTWALRVTDVSARTTS